MGLKLLVYEGMILELLKNDFIELCECCIYGKQMSKYFLVGKSWRASNHFELIYADFFESMHSIYFCGSRYFLLFTDDCSRMSWVYFLESK